MCSPGSVGEFSVTRFAAGSGQEDTCGGDGFRCSEDRSHIESTSEVIENEYRHATCTMKQIGVNSIHMAPTKLFFSLIVLFLTGFYLPFETYSFLFLIPALCGIILALLSFRSASIVVLCCAAFLGGAGLMKNTDRNTHPASPFSEEGIWKGLVETSSESGVMIQADDGLIWVSSEELPKECFRGDSIEVLGSLRYNFLTPYAYHIKHSCFPVAGFRRYLCAEWNSRIPDTVSSSLVCALLTGERGSIPAEVRSTFQNTGTTHLLAVSGLHVGLVVAIFMLLLKKFRKSLKIPLVLLAVVFFVFLTGVRPSTVRAAVMAGLFMIILWGWGRDVDSLIIWGLTVVLVTLIMGTEVLLDRGAQLSFGAVLSLMLFGRRFRGRFSWVLSAFYAGVVVTVSISPLVSSLYGYQSLAGPLATVLSLPFMMAVMTLGFPVMLPAPLYRIPVAVLGFIVSAWMSVQSVFDLPYVNVTGMWLLMWGLAVFVLFFLRYRIRFIRHFR